MKLACQIGRLPGESIDEKFTVARELGCEGIEIMGGELLEDRRKIEEYVEISESSGVKISSICAGYRSFLLDPSVEDRKRAREDIKELLEMGGNLEWWD